MRQLQQMQDEMDRMKADRDLARRQLAAEQTDRAEPVVLPRRRVELRPEPPTKSAEVSGSLNSTSGDDWQHLLISSTRGCGTGSLLGRCSHWRTMQGHKTSSQILANSATSRSCCCSLGTRMLAIVTWSNTSIGQT